MSVQDLSPALIVLKRVKIFANEMLGQDEESDGKTVTLTVSDRRSNQKI